MTRGGARPGAGQPPVAGQPQTERIGLKLTEAERAEIEAAVPNDRPVGRWIVEAAIMRSRSVPRTLSEVTPDRLTRKMITDLLAVGDVRVATDCQALLSGRGGRARLGLIRERVASAYNRLIVAHETSSSSKPDHLPQDQATLNRKDAGLSSDQAPVSKSLALSESAQRRLVRHLMIGHPLPWSLEFDWTVEITDANNAIVIKCMHVDEALEIVGLAKFLTVDDNAAREEFEHLLSEPVP